MMSGLGGAEDAGRKGIMRRMLHEVGYAPIGDGQPSMEEVVEILWPLPVERVSQPEPRRLRIEFDRRLTEREAFELARLFECAVEVEADYQDGPCYAEVAWLPM